MKISPVLYPGLALLFFLLSCGNGPPDSVKNAKETNAAKIDSQKTMERPVDSAAILMSKSDADFLVNAASGGMMEVQLGATRADVFKPNQRIKAFGAMMVKDHNVKLEKVESARRC